MIRNCPDRYSYGGGIASKEDGITARPRLPIAPHLSPDGIAHRYGVCRTGVEKPHWQALRFLTRPGAPPAPAEVAAQVGLTPCRVRTVLGRWNDEGPGGLADRRAATNGGK